MVAGSLLLSSAVLCVYVCVYGSGGEIAYNNSFHLSYFYLLVALSQKLLLIFFLR